MDYFKEYGSRELKFMQKFIRNHKWLDTYFKEVKPDNTSLHDLMLVTYDNKIYTVEVKEDEYYWYSKTNNIGLDYISSFTFNDKKDENKWNNLWVNSNEISYFEEVITVKKYGKLITCDADFQFYFVLNEDKTEFVYAKLYSNKKLKAPNFIQYLKNNYRLRINDKRRYNLKDCWESAAFFVNPLKDKMLQACEINNINDIED